MNKNQKGFGVLGGLLILIIIILIGLAGWYVLARKDPGDKNTQITTNNRQNLAEGTTVTQSGKAESIDLSAMATDGPGVFKVKTANQEELTIHLDAGESDCDRNAIKVPDVKVGDEVRIKGIKGSDGVIRVCDTGTYIK